MKGPKWRMNQKEWETLLHEITKRLTDEGKIIEAGFAGFKMHVFPNDEWKTLPQEQESQLRMAFFAGAHHFYSTMNAVTDDPGLEPTERELARIKAMHNELEQFIKTFQHLHTPTAGRA